MLISLSEYSTEKIFFSSETLNNFGPNLYCLQFKASS